MTVFYIDEFEFASKAEAQARVSSILHKYAVGTPILDPEDDLLLRSLARTHAWHRSIVGVGIDHFEVGYKPPYKNSRTFVVVRLNGTRTFLAATRYFQLHNKDKAANFRSRCRLAIKPQIDQFRHTFFLIEREPMCPLSGVPLTPSTTHVDHVVPFEDLVQSWETMTNNDYSAKSVKAFAEWHKGHAVLRCIDRTANLQRGRNNG